MSYLTRVALPQRDSRSPGEVPILLRSEEAVTTCHVLLPVEIPALLRGLGTGIRLEFITPKSEGPHRAWGDDDE